MKSILKTLGIGLLSTAFSVGLMAAAHQPEITTTVNADGSTTYTVNPGQANEQIITIGTDGSASIGGSAITIPTMPDFTPDATINEDGDLVLADGSIVARPDLGVDFNIETIFGNTIVGLEGKISTSNGWYFSYNFKGLYHTGETNPEYIYIQKMGSVFYVDPSASSINDGLWVYGFDFPIVGNDTWVFLQSGGGFLVDVRDLDGDSQSQKRIFDSYFYIASIGGSEGGIYQFLESSALSSAFVAPAGSGDFVQVWPR